MFEDHNSRTFRVSKEVLIQTLKKNKLKHVEDYTTAVKGWRVRMKKALDLAVSNFNSSLETVMSDDTCISSVKDKTLDHMSAVTKVLSDKPESKERDYERTIAMLEMIVDTTVDITTDEYRKFVEDDWSWKRAITQSYQTNTMFA